MATEAIENVMLDALEDALGAIGSAPTSDWNTLPAPALKIGVPGDPVPKPNKTTLYVQHVTSGEGSDSVGTALHQLDAVFHVWCVSSHPADGHRRMLQLKEDVRRALLAYEPVFYETFKYGLKLGPFSFSADEAFVRAGVAAGVQEVRITADVPHPEPYSLIHHPFEFPFPTGSARMLLPSPTMNNSYDANIGSLTNGAREVIFSSPPGTSGIVRNISFVVVGISEDGSTTIVPNCTFEVKYDGSATPTISIPLLTLLAMEYPRSSLKDLVASTPAFEITAGMYMSASPSVVRGVAGNFRLPIPYTDGIEISVVAPATADVQQLYANVVHQDTLPRCWNSRLRLCVDRSVATIPAGSTIGSVTLTDSTHAQAVSGTFPENIVGRVLICPSICSGDMLVLERLDATHVVVSAKDTKHAILNTPDVYAYHAACHTFLNRPAGESGWLAMIVGAQSNSADVNFLFEGNPRLFLDQHAEADLEWTAVEDFANGAYYFEQPRQGEEGGIISLNTSTFKETSFYKVFHRWPIPYRDGVKGTVPQYSDVVQSSFTWTTFYYKQM